jgi:short-subunit dehydrogenase
VGYYSGRVAVVTGAGSGIGRAVAVALAAQGVDLALADRDGSAVASTAQQCQGGVRTRADIVDVTDRQAVLDCSTAVLADFGRIDLVFAAAGVIHAGSLLVSEFTDIDRVIEVNLLGVMQTAKAFLPALISSGRGHLVTFSSGFGLMAAPHYSAYSASKFAVRGFSEALRQEMTRDGHPVTVTCVYPGRIRTPIMRNGSLRTASEHVREQGRNLVAARGGYSGQRDLVPVQARGVKSAYRVEVHCPGQISRQAADQAGELLPRPRRVIAPGWRDEAGGQQVLGVQLLGALQRPADQLWPGPAGGHARSGLAKDRPPAAPRVQLA